MQIAEQIARWSDRLRDISALGLRYAQNFYDREHFEMVQDMAMQMLAVATGETMDEVEPLRDPVFSRPTPMVGVDAAVIDAQGRLLLIQRADNHLWAMPGGLTDVGESPSATAPREALEESGVHCRAVAPVGVFDSRLWHGPQRHQILQFIFLCEPVPDAPVEAPSHAVEVLGSGWFAEGELPDDLDPGHASRIPEVWRVWHGDARVHFD